MHSTANVVVAARLERFFASLAKDMVILPFCRFALVVVLLAGLSPLAGCAYVAKSVGTRETPSNDQRLPIRRILQTRRMMLDSMPVGSIVAFYYQPNLAIPENWMFCNGDVVEDVESLLQGTRVPNLQDERFLMGDDNRIGQYGGNNTLSASGDHSHKANATRAGQHAHGGRTGTEGHNGFVRQIEQEGEAQVRLTEQAHRHAITSDGVHLHEVTVTPSGNHDHGGDIRPSWFGVVYIIKIK